MKKVFADTGFWIASVWPQDPYAKAAKDAEKKLGKAQTVTTDEVLSETLNFFCEKGDHLRKVASASVSIILKNPNVKVLPQTRPGFLRALDFYKARPDKGYSLVDCISMGAMREEGIQEVLTTDDHFAQEGFTVLMKKDK